MSGGNIQFIWFKFVQTTLCMRKNIALVTLTMLTALSLVYAYVHRENAVRIESLAFEMERQLAEQRMIANEQMKVAADCKTESELRILQLEYEIEKMKERGY